MQTQSLHRSGARSALGDAFPRRNILEPLIGDIHDLGTAVQDTAGLDLTLELIEMRYQEHLAHQDLQALFASGELCGPCPMAARDGWSDP